MTPETIGWILLALLLAAAVIGARRLVAAAERANAADWGCKWRNRLDGWNRLFCQKVHGLDDEIIQLPRDEGQLVVANHISGVDGNLLLAKIDKPLHFIIAREQYERFGLRWLFKRGGFIPVDRKGRPDKAMGVALEMLANNGAVAIFPQGHINKDIPDKPLKRGVTFLACRSQAPIYPFHISGVRGAGMNVAAVFLPDKTRVESFPPIFCDGKEPDEILEQIRRLIFGLN